MIRLRPVLKITYAALFIGLNILLTRLVGLAQVGAFFSWARIAPGTSVTIFASIFLGPLYGALVGVAGDALGWLLLGQFTGTFNFFLSIYYAIMGCLPFFIFKGFTSLKKSYLKWGALWVLVVLLGLFATLGIWLSKGVENILLKANFELNVARIVLTIITFVFLCGSILVSILVGRKQKDKKMQMMADATLGDCFGVSLSYELIAALLKPVAFIAFYSLILGNSLEAATGVDYLTIVVLTLIFACVNIPLNAFLLSLYFRYGNILVRGKTNE